MNKGFTLVELLGTIVILAIIMAIAVPSITSISETIKERQREHLIEKIEIAAAKYAYDTGETVVFVETLVTEGYLDGKEYDVVEDPLTNNILNCYVVEMEKQKDYYVAKFIDDINYKDNGSCNFEELTDYYSDFSINISAEKQEGDWYGGEVYLEAISSDFDIDCENDKCVWTSSSGANVVGKSKIKLEQKLLNANYTFQIIKNDKEYINDYEYGLLLKYKSSINVKIDNQSPTIYENEIKVTDKFIYTSSKNVTISATDGHGSGIDGYYLGIDNGESCDNVNLEYIPNKTFNVTENGNYLICVKDKMGNTSKYSMPINYIG